MRRDVGRIPWGFFRASKRLGVTVLVDREGGADLIPVTIWDAHKLTIFEIAKVCGEKVNNAKRGKDKRHENSTVLANYIPSVLGRVAIFVFTYIAGTLEINVDLFSLRDDTFGHVVVTNVGTLGYTAGIAPLAPPLHQMALLCTGAIQKRVVYNEKTEALEIGKTMTVVTMGDHRYGDASIFVPFFDCFKGFLEDP